MKHLIFSLLVLLPSIVLSNNNQQYFIHYKRRQGSCTKTCNSVGMKCQSTDMRETGCHQSALEFCGLKSMNRLTTSRRKCEVGLCYANCSIGLFYQNGRILGPCDLESTCHGDSVYGEMPAICQCIGREDGINLMRLLSLPVVIGLFGLAISLVLVILYVAKNRYASGESYSQLLSTGDDVSVSGRDIESVHSDDHTLADKDRTERYRSLEISTPPQRQPSEKKIRSSATSEKRKAKAKRIAEEKKARKV
mmetsp:Transcript_827/g.1396  ORF Transcript_827/g.1396 Transcript_827/m.1396 type:complete len:250 (-) Transcript_827:166-915(-)